MACAVLHFLLNNYVFKLNLRQRGGGGVGGLSTGKRGEGATFPCPSQSVFLGPQPHRRPDL